MARESVGRDEGVMVEIGPGITMWSSSRAELAGRQLLVEDIHHQPMLTLKFQKFLHKKGDVIYFMYLPLPQGELLKQFLTEVAQLEGIEL